MSSLPHESFPAPHESETSVTIAEVRTEIVDTVESIIITAIDKAIKMKINGIKKVADELKAGMTLADSQDLGISIHGRQFIEAIDVLREKASLLSNGLRNDVTNEDLVHLVDWLTGHNEICKTAFDNKDLVNNTDSLISVVNRSANGIQGHLSVGDKPLLSDEAKKELNRRFPSRAK